MSNNDTTNNLTPIDIFYQIMTDKEPKPDLESDLWKISADNQTYVILAENIQEISYYINDSFVNSMKEYSKFIRSFSKSEQNKFLRNIKKDLFARIFLIENLKTGYKYIDHTYNTLIYTIKLNLHKRNMSEKSVFDHFIDGKLTDIKCTILEFIKTNQKNIVQNHKKYYNELLISKPKKDIATKIRTDNINNKYNQLHKIYCDILKKYKIKADIREYFIYQISNTLTKKKYIFGTINKINNQEIFNKILRQIIDRNNQFREDIIKIGYNNFILTMLDIYNGTSELDFYLRIDYFIYFYDSIRMGYNTKYNLPESTFYQKKLPTNSILENIEGSLFVRIQRERFNKNFEDKRNYSKIKGFVVMISYNDDKYITFGKNITLKELILTMYHKILNGASKDDDICPLLYNIPYDMLIFKMLRIQHSGSRINLQKESSKYKDKFEL